VMRSRIPDETIDLVVTSPPYYGLRDYGDDCATVWGGDPDCEHDWIETVRLNSLGGPPGSTADVRNTQLGIQRFEIKEGTCRTCGAWRGQLGHEADPDTYVEHLMTIIREIYRVLKPTGSFWLNLGDTYYGGQDDEDDPEWLQDQQLLGVPERVLVAMQKEGWILRNKIIWTKPNAMPSSTKTRFTPKHEVVYFFVKQVGYFFDYDAVSIPRQLKLGEKIEGDLRGKNPGDVWSIPTEACPDAHFAVFPPALVEPIIKACCPREVCLICGKPRERIWESRKPEGGYDGVRNVGGRTDGYMTRLGKNIRAIWIFKGWSKCSCGAGFIPGMVLDPFAGSGTALRVARHLNRSFIGIEIVPKYAEMSQRRVKTDVYKQLPNGVVPLSEYVEEEKIG